LSWAANGRRRSPTPTHPNCSGQQADGSRWWGEGRRQLIIRHSELLLQQSFVFIDIPASFLHFLKWPRFLLSPWKVTSCRGLPHGRRRSPTPSHPNCSRQQADGGRRWREGRGQFIIHNSQFRVVAVTALCFHRYSRFVPSFS